MRKSIFAKTFKTEIKNIKSANTKESFRESLRYLSAKVKEHNLNVVAWDFVSSNFDGIITVIKPNNRSFRV